MSPHAALGIVIIATLLVSTRPASASEPGQTPIHVYCGTGDHLWVREREPVDSPATIDAMFEWMAETYGVKRVYWRGGQSHLWDSHYKLGPESPQAYDWAMGWKHHLYNDLKINEAAVDSARRHEMEIFMYTGLFEHGVQPDVGIISPYLFEDQLRIDHPEWCVVDRWGERRCPGPIAFCYPEARRAVIDRYVRHVVDSGYDGINFYTYVENVGIRYLDEFGFNQPVLDEFNKRYPEVNLREDALTAEQKLYWHECRGKFVTDFLRELHEALAAEGKALSVIIDSKEPDYAQPWWGKEIPGTGLIHMDWETWVAEGIIDELWVQLGYVADQRAVLDRALGKAAGTDVKLTVRTPTPFDAGWDPYVEAGVTPIACITSPVSGIERVTLEPTSVAALTSPDWRMRVQALADITGGALEADAATVASLADDPHVLVRRRTMDALAALGAGEQVPVIERALTAESESSVRMAAAGALVHVNGPESPQRILAALEGDGHFQFKLACIEALAAMARRSLPAVTEGTQHPSQAVREVSVRALYKLGKGGLADEVYDPIRAALRNPDEDDRVRYWATDGLVGLRLEYSPQRHPQFTSDLIAMVRSEAPPVVQLHAAYALGYMFPFMTPEMNLEARTCLADLFREYGDDSRRSDAAFGWRVVGNAMLQFHAPGRAMLEDFRSQADDRWLAWIAYEVVHAPQRAGVLALTDEASAIEAHDKYAPAFPGIRQW